MQVPARSTALQEIRFRWFVTMTGDPDERSVESQDAESFSKR
jgi:hypothetical protein